MKRPLKPKDFRGWVVVAPFCYGYPDGWRQLENKVAYHGYLRYLESVAEYLNQLQDYLEEGSSLTVLPCGGKIRGESEPSEATMAVPVIQALLTGQIPEFMLEEKSTNTEQNVLNAILFVLRRHERMPIHLVFGCDNHRKLPVKVIAWYLCRWHGIKSWEVRSFKRRDNHPHSRLWWQLIRAIRCLVKPSLILKRIGKEVQSEATVA